MTRQAKQSCGALASAGDSVPFVGRRSADVEVAMAGEEDDGSDDT